MTTTNVFLLQLPVQSQSYEYSRVNIPLAMGYLQGFAREHLRRTEIHIVPPEVMSYGGDAAILHFLEQERPDVVGFGCALWNVERTLHLCRRIKSACPETVLLLGGPEVSWDNTFLFASDAFDFAILGEGEQTFTDLLVCLENGGADFGRIPGLAHRTSGEWVFNAQWREPIQPLDAIPSPYLSGLINPSFAGSMAVETVRGCPYRCAYCHYHKSFSRVRAFDLARIQEELCWAVDRGVKEVCFLDPCFARRPHLQVLLRMIQALNCEKHFHIQCELNAEDLSGELVQGLALAGVEEVEVGLQTINPTSLDLIHRRFERDKFIEGARMVRGMGIRVLVDLVVGLPGDSHEDVKRSIDFVLENRLCDELKLYPLSVLPGTELRKRAVELGLRYQQRPPYAIMETPRMGPDQIFKAFLYAEEVTGVDFFALDVPAVFDESGESTRRADTWKSEGSHGVPIHEIVLKGADSEEPAGPATVLSSREVGQSLCVHIEDPHWQEKLETLCRFLEPLLDVNRFTLVDWLIPEESYPTEKSLEAITGISLWLDHPLNREYFAAHTPIRSTRVFMMSRIDQGLVIARIPLFGERNLLDRVALSDVQFAGWIAFPPQAGHEQEDQLAERYREKLKPEAPGLLFSELPVGWPSNNRDPRMRRCTISI